MADNKTQIIITAKDETRAAIASAQRGLDSLATSGASLRSAFGFLGAAGGIAGLIGGAGLAATVKTAIDSLDALNDSAERLGIAAEDLSALNFAGTLNGVAADEMSEALKKLSVKMKEAADGGKEAGALFSALGVTVTDASGKLKSADAVFAEIATAFAGMEDGAGKTAIAVETFGKSGAKLVPVLNAGADGLEKMRKEGESLGAVIDGKLAKQAAEFNDNLDRLKVVSAAAGIAIAGELLPSLNKLTQEFLDGITAAGGFWAALNAGATLNPFKSAGENLATVRADLAKMEADVKEYGYLDEERYKRKQNQLKMLEAQDARLRAQMAKGLGLDDIDALVPKKAAPSTAASSSSAGRAGGSARAQADEAARLIAQLNEQIALKGIDAESTDKMTAAEQQRAKVLYQLDAGTLKATAAQREKIATALDELVVLERTLQAQKEFTAAVEKQEQANVKDRQAMLEQIAAAEKAAELYGLTEAQISVVEQARLADAIAIAEQNGATEEQIAYMKEELRLRGQLSEALSAVDGKRYGAEDAKKAIESVNELDEFTKSAAKNMQSAFADFLFDPAAEGFDDMAKQFGKTVQRMIAEAASAQLMKLLLGDYATNGKSGDSGLLGGLFGAVGSFDWAGLFGFADGGIMTSAGPVPLKKYAMGGIARSPQLAMFGEGSTPEAYVPLPDGRRIPVAMQGGGQPVVQNMNFYGAAEPAQVKRAAAAGARQVLNVANGSRRYG